MKLYYVKLKYLVSELKKADKKRDNATKKLMEMIERENMHRIQLKGTVKQ